MEILVKVGDNAPKDHPDYNLFFRDGHIVSIAPDGFFKGRMERKHFVVLNVPDNFMPSSELAIKGLLGSKDSQGNNRWDLNYDREEKKRPRDYFIDFKDLLDNKKIDQATFESIYNKNVDHKPITITENYTNFIKHEDVVTRKENNLAWR